MFIKNADMFWIVYNIYFFFFPICCVFLLFFYLVFSWLSFLNFILKILLGSLNVCLVDLYLFLLVNSPFIYLNILTIMLLYFCIWYKYTHLILLSLIFTVFCLHYFLLCFLNFFYNKILFVKLYKIPLSPALKVYYFKKILHLHMPTTLVISLK